MKKLLSVLLILALLAGIGWGTYMTYIKKQTKTMPEDVLFKQGIIIDINHHKDTTYITLGKSVEDIESSTILKVGKDTIIVDKQGNKLKVNDLKVGDNIGAYHSMVMTFSIPPQTEAYKIIKN